MGPAFSTKPSPIAILRASCILNGMPWAEFTKSMIDLLTWEPKQEAIFNALNTKSGSWSNLVVNSSATPSEIICISMTSRSQIQRRDWTEYSSMPFLTIDLRNWTMKNGLPLVFNSTRAANRLVYRKGRQRLAESSLVISACANSPMSSQDTLTFLLCSTSVMFLMMPSFRLTSLLRNVPTSKSPW